VDVGSGRLVTGEWLDGAAETGFGLDALPYGVFSVGGGTPRLGVRIGDRVLDLAPVAEAAGVETLVGMFDRSTLNPFMAQGPQAWADARSRITEWLTSPQHEATIAAHLHLVVDASMQLPIRVADYVDFYSSRHHAENLGAILRPGQPALTPNWLHMPIGYHGRAGTVVVTGTPVVRPAGQRRPSPDAPPVFGPSARLDIEAEVGFVVGTPSSLGAPVPVADALDHVFGVVLVNDWSARDIQAWEYQPLGPFLGKSFATSMSAWVLPLAALDAARVTAPARSEPVLGYLDEPGAGGFDLDLEVELNGHVVSRPQFREMYWTPAQQLAHMTVNGACLRTGDLFASGTVSGPEPDQRGSFIELSWNARDPLTLPDGSTRTFLEDGDEVRITATAPGPNATRIALGEVTATIHPTP
jgi:fumarylacetoacetase